MILLAFFLAVTSLTPTVEQTLDYRIPVVDMRDYYVPEKHDDFIDTLHQAMRKVGFFAVRNTGVRREIIQNAYDQARQFFKQDRIFKEQVRAPNGQRGFTPGETAKGNRTKDCKEFYHIGRELAASEYQKIGIAPNIWPNQAGFKEDLTSLYRELEQYVGFLFEAIVEAMNRDSAAKISSNVFAHMTKEGDSLLRTLYYPSLSDSQVEHQDFFWAAPHTDIDLLAILPFATEKGLQVELDGQWLNVVVPEDAFIVNVGDMLENLTNGLFISARHRVAALEAGKERYSMVFFVHPTDQTSLAPFASCIEQTGGVQRYAPGTRQEFLWERLLELNIAPALLEPYSKSGHAERQMQFGRESDQVVEMLIKNNLASQELLEAARKSNAAGS